MPLLHPKKNPATRRLQAAEQPELFREIFPYSRISRVPFDGVYVEPRPANPMFLTDTSLRDGQQAHPPYTVRQIVKIYDLLHELGGRSGLIRSCEFFMYTDKDRRAVEECRSRGYAFPEITGWIRAHKDDLRLARDMQFREVGMLTSASDYHIYLKLGWNRKKAFDNYVSLISRALEWGISPRCHFEDITRADIYGFCIPLAGKLMDLSQQSGVPVRIRLCDTLGYGVPYPGAALPRSVPRLVRAFTDEAGVPGEWLEWHGHNDFHKVLVNACTAWLYGCSGVNGALLGFGERTGNTPLEAMIIEYISMTGEDNAANTRVISDIVQFYEKDMGFRVPGNYPFAGKDFNATSAGIHVDGLSKSEEIYNIFDTKTILGRSTPILINDKTGRAGVAYWLNQYLELGEDEQVSKAHPAVGKIYARILAAYEGGRRTTISNKEMFDLAKRYLPELVPSELERLRALAKRLSMTVVAKLATDHAILGEGNGLYPWMQPFLKDYPFIQFLQILNTEGRLLASAIVDPTYADRYEDLPLGFDFSQRDWFKAPMRTGKLFISDFYRSNFTFKLILTVAAPVINEQDEISGIIAADILLEELLRQPEEPENGAQA
ncbi:MAG: histone-lysine N-methyltransferase [Deltaproteobacteria bacterium]|jgi:isopropylmalate/homocitrate/citramalate synthase|nr:histone-lysine N-methyltransferase [Deltaproteobacteria bacterium]